MKQGAIEYILEWLTGGGWGKYVGYTGEKERWGEYKVVIVPSGKFGEGEPEEPLGEIEGIPLLFGRGEVTREGDTIVVWGDIVASTFFLISRWEEIMRRGERDEHGRFIGRRSLVYRNGFMERPVADEYGMLLRKWLREAGVKVRCEERRIHKLYLTHDVDAPFLYRTWRGVVRSLLEGRGLKVSIAGRYGEEELDPWYTFPKLFRWDKEVKEVVRESEVIYFFKGGGGRRQEDKPWYEMRSEEMQRLVAKVKERGAKIGMHSSYRAGMEPRYIKKEKMRLEEAIGEEVAYNRHHYLGVREPEDYKYLEEAGIKEDFSMGYADVAGYRLGTSRAVRWIEPETYRVSGLMLHPLTVMDVTLMGERYMGMGEEEAVRYCEVLVRGAEKVGGDVSLLWHNSSPLEVYRKVLEMIMREGEGGKYGE
jgi:hypothetical protein